MIHHHTAAEPLCSASSWSSFAAGVGGGATSAAAPYWPNPTDAAPPPPPPPPSFHHFNSNHINFLHPPHTFHSNNYTQESESDRLLHQLADSHDGAAAATSAPPPSTPPTSILNIDRNAHMKEEFESLHSSSHGRLCSASSHGREEPAATGGCRRLRHDHGFLNASDATPEGGGMRTSSSTVAAANNIMHMWSGPLMHMVANEPASVDSSESLRLSEILYDGGLPEHHQWRVAAPQINSEMRLQIAMSIAAAAAAAEVADGGGAWPATRRRQLNMLLMGNGDLDLEEEVLGGGSYGASCSSSSSYKRQQQMELQDLLSLYSRSNNASSMAAAQPAEESGAARNFNEISRDWGSPPSLGLNLGGRTYFAAEFEYEAAAEMGAMKRRRRLLEFEKAAEEFPMIQLPAAPICQADGCGEDLSEAKHYHRRHKVCEYHSKCATVSIANQKQRFCQQCSRFHSLAEFDDGKRSCRRRLADHNRRRRKHQFVGCGNGSAGGESAAEASYAGENGSYAAENGSYSGENGSYAGGAGADAGVGGENGKPAPA